ncbi:MAG: SseB family protein [Gammaproteobacteria bacterium]
MSEEGQQPVNQPAPTFDPNAELEYLLAGAKTGKVSIITVYQALLRAPLYAMFDRAMDPENLDTTANALVFETGDMGNLMVLFTAPEHSEKIGSDVGEFSHPGQLAGEYVVGSLAADTGIILNPGHEYGMKLSASGLARLKDDFGTRSGPQSGSGEAGGNGGPLGGPPGSAPPDGGMPFPQLN